MSAPQQEAIPYDVLIGQMEAELHRRDSEILMLRARLDVRDQRIAQLEAQLAQGRSSAGQTPQGAQQQFEQEQVELPPPADQQPVPEVGTQRPAVVS